LFEFFDHGGRWGATARAINQWRHPVASSEIMDVLYRVMCPVLCRCIVMAIEIASNSPAFFVAIDSLLPTAIAK